MPVELSQALLRAKSDPFKFIPTLGAQPERYNIYNSNKSENEQIWVKIYVGTFFWIEI
jgi:hypothetical protein